MKKLLIVILAIFLMSCSNTKLDNEVHETTTPEENKKMSFSCNNINEQFNYLNIKYPTVIDTFIGEDNNYLGFIYLTECSDEEYEYIKDAIHRNEEGTAYLYYGYMNKIKDNLFAVDGNYLFPTWNEYENIVTENIDFYVYIEDDKLYFIFDYIENLNNYQDYIDYDHYAIYQNSWS